MKGGNIQPLKVPDRPGRDYSMDFAVGLPESQGKNGALILVDRFSKRIRIRACSDTITAEATAQIVIDELLRNNGMINSIVSDRDTRFVSAFWQEYFRLLGTTLKMSTARHPQTDGQSERSIQTIKTMLRHYVNERQSDWLDQLAMIEFAHNTSVQKSTGKTPFEVETGENPPSTMALALLPGIQYTPEIKENIWKEVKQSLEKTREEMIKHQNKSRRDIYFEVGDLVKLRSSEFNPPIKSVMESSKLGPKWYGPFKVLEKVGNVCYKIELPPGSKGHPVFHTDVLEKYHLSHDVTRHPPPPDPILLDGEVEYEVEAILGRKKVRNTMKWLVKWKGHGISMATWEPKKSLNGNVIWKKYNDDHPIEKQKKK